MAGADLHDRFDAWLRSGASGEPPRDAAIHASVCEECLRKVVALDSLAEVDLGAAPVPPSLPSERLTAPGRLRRPAFVLGTAAAVVIGVATGSLAGPLLLGDRGIGEQQVQAATGTPAPSPGGSLILVPPSAGGSLILVPPSAQRPTVTPEAAPSFATSVLATATPVVRVPTPVPDDCADGIDNDGDGLVDAADPGCTLGTYEAFADPQPPSS